MSPISGKPFVFTISSADRHALSAQTSGAVLSASSPVLRFEASQDAICLSVIAPASLIRSAFVRRQPFSRQALNIRLSYIT
mgnify:CR=1 FL=1